MNTKKETIKTSVFSLICNILLSVIKGIAGFLGNSHALIADAIESTSDVFASIILLLGIKYSHKPADKNHPYGHGKIEPLTTFIIVGFLIISATIIAYNSIQNIGSSQDMPKVWTLIVLSIIILWKEILYRIINKTSKKTKSTSLKAEAWHHRSDSITSFTAFLGISVALIFGKGYETADDWAALIASVIILYNSYKIFRPALGEIMDENVYDDLTKKIKITATKVNGILDTEKCFIRKAGTQFHVDLHAIVDANISVKQGHDLAHELKNHLKKEITNLGNVLIHIEPFNPNY